MREPLRIVLVDDEPLARSRLRTLLADCHSPDATVVAETATAVQAVDFILHHNVDALLADIHMPGADGLALAQVLKERKSPVGVVFVTAYAEHAVQAFELEAVDYLTKPVRLERLQVALQKIERFLLSNKEKNIDFSEDFLTIQERGRSLRVPLSDVLYFKAELKYITVRTAQHRYLLEGSLNHLEYRYGQRVLRIHRNALAVRSAILALELRKKGGVVKLRGIDEELWVSRRHLGAVRAWMNSA